MLHESKLYSFTCRSEGGTIETEHLVYGHLGATKLETIFRRLFYTPNALKDIKKLTNSCVVCKMNKIYEQRKQIEYAQIKSYAIGDVISANLYAPIANAKKVNCNTV